MEKTGTRGSGITLFLPEGFPPPDRETAMRRAAGSGEEAAGTRCRRTAGRAAPRGGRGRSACAGRPAWGASNNFMIVPFYSILNSGRYSTVAQPSGHLDLARADSLNLAQRPASLDFPHRFARVGRRRADSKCALGAHFVGAVGRASRRRTHPSQQGERHAAIRPTLLHPTQGQKDRSSPQRAREPGHPKFEAYRQSSTSLERKQEWESSLT